MKLGKRQSKGLLGELEVINRYDQNISYIYLIFSKNKYIIKIKNKNVPPPIKVFRGSIKLRLESKRNNPNHTIFH